MTEFVRQEFRNPRFERVDLTGASFVGVDLSHVSIRSSDLTGLRVRGTDLTDIELNGWSFPVRECLLTILNEEWEHRLYAERDLAILEERA